MKRPLRTPGILAILAGALLAACRAVPPAASAPAASGVVRADTPERAADVARLLDDVVPRVRALLPGVEDQPVEVWVERELSRYPLVSAPRGSGAYTLTVHNRIHVTEGHALFGQLLAHEVVHALLDDSWRALPGILEEGLADQVGTRLFPEHRAYVRASRLLGVAARYGRLPLKLRVAAPRGGVDDLHLEADVDVRGEPPTRPWPVRDALSISAEDLAVEEFESDRLVLRGLGFLMLEALVERVGYEGLHELCLEARRLGRKRVAVEELCAASGLAEDYDSWAAASVRAWTTEELRVLAREVRPELVEMIHRSMRLLGSPPESAGGLLEWEVRLGIPQTGVWISLLEMDEVVRALVARGI